MNQFQISPKQNIQKFRTNISHAKNLMKLHNFENKFTYSEKERTDHHSAFFTLQKKVVFILL